jgi:hypothetical protein
MDELLRDFGFVANLLSAGVLALAILELSALRAIRGTPFTVFRDRNACRVLCCLGRHERDKNYLFVVEVTGTMKRTLFCRRPGCKHELPYKPVKPGE